MDRPDEGSMQNTYEVKIDGHTYPLGQLTQDQLITFAWMVQVINRNQPVMVTRPGSGIPVLQWAAQK
jgi:hypothetical protein